MTRVKRAVMVAGFSVAAGVAGYALGLVFEPVVILTHVDRGRSSTARQ